MQYKYGIKIGENADIGYGCRIVHFGGIFINSGCKIGNNIDIYHDVTIGINVRGAYKNGSYCPQLMNNIVIGAGAKIMGPVLIESNVAIGANSVVTKDVPAHVTIGGIPSKIISYKGSDSMMHNLWPVKG